MRIENEFGLDATADAAWGLLTDVPAIVPCMPGAELVEVVDDDRWKALLRTKLGAMTFIFDADVTRESVDEGARTVVLVAKATDRSGRGEATARITSTLLAAGEASRGAIVTELTLAGTIARFGRKGLIEDVSRQLVNEFAGNLEDRLGAADAVTAQASANESTAPSASTQPREETVPPPAAAPPLRALPLLLRAIGAAIGRFFTRIAAAIARPFKR